MSSIDSLPPLREIISRHDLAAQKKLGQNFLLDFNITTKIARQAGPLSGKTVVEIGPGPGGLTRALLSEGAENVIAIERDIRCEPVLSEIKGENNQRFHYRIGDALELDLNHLVDEIVGGGSYLVIANLPYNVATPLFTRWISPEVWPPRWEAMVLMFQKEVAERITATPSVKSWGRLGVLSNWRTHSKIAFDLSPQAFSPPPKVTSSVVVIRPNPTPLSVDRTKLELVSKHAFGQRRKMLRQSLKPLGGETLLQSANIDPTARAEELNVEDFVSLANSLGKSAQ